VYISYVQQEVPRYPGSILKAKSPGLWPDHLGIFAEPLPDGTPMVIHSNGACVVHTSLDEFARGRMFEVVDKPRSREHQLAILGRAYSQIGHRHDNLFANCEHLVTWAFYGVAESPQLKKYIAGAGAVVVLGLFFGLGGETT
jgi:hypothetical protein